MITKKNSCGSKIPLPPPHNFSNGPSLIQLVFCKKKKLCGLLEEIKRVHTLLKKILDPPLDVHILLPKYCRQKHIPTFLFYMYQPKLDILFARKVKAKIAYFRFYYIHCEITGHPCNLIGSQQCDLSHHKSQFCSKSHLF